MAPRKAISSTVSLGNVSRVSGIVNIAGGNIQAGYTAKQVSLLLKQISATFQPKKFDGRCPYKGLDVFEEEDAHLFFGRETLVDDLLRRVKESRAIFVIGPSGSGKSSLVRAGLIHALRGGTMKDRHSELWVYETITPGPKPMEALSLALSRVKSPALGNYFRQHAKQVKALDQCAESALTQRKDQRFVLFIDQFEEIFTQVNDEKKRLLFLNLLAYAATVEHGRMILLFSMRSDFVSNLAAYPQLNALFNEQSIQIGAMQPEELVSAIARPALRVGLRIDPSLIAQIINDMQGEPGALPLMQFALRDLFDAEQAKRGVIALRLEDYLARGGIHKSLERHADRAFEELSKKEQELAHSIFGNLIEIGRGTQDTRRTAPLDDLIPANANKAEVQSTIQKLADARLITTDERDRTKYTITHEKLIDAWPWLKKLVNENRDVFALQNEISNDAKEWEEHQRDTSYLYTGARLANVREQLEARKLVLSGTASEFVQAGQARRQRTQWSLIAGISAVIGLLFIAVLAFRSQATINANTAGTAQAVSTFAIAQQVTAQANAEAVRQQANINSAAQFAALAQAKSQSNLDVSLLLSLEASHKNDNSRTRSVLLDTLLVSPHLRHFLFGSPAPILFAEITDLAFSPDGEILASTSCGETGAADLFCGASKMDLWDVATGRRLGEPISQFMDEQESAPSSSMLMFSPNHKIVALGTRSSTFGLFDVKTGKPINQQINFSGRNVAVSPDGKIIAFASCDLTKFPDGCPSADRNHMTEQIMFLNFETGEPTRQPLKMESRYISDLAFSAYGNLLTSIGCFQDKPFAGCQQEVVLWDLRTGNIIGEPWQLREEIIRLSPDGKTIAVKGQSETILLFDAANGQQIGTAIPGRFVTFSPDGETLATADSDKITLWNVKTGQQLRQVLAELPLAFSPNSQILATASNDTIILLDKDTGQQIDQMFSGNAKSAVASLAFSRDGKLLAAGNMNGDVMIFDLDLPSPVVQAFSNRNRDIAHLSINPDEKVLTAVDYHGTVQQWNVESGQTTGKTFMLPEHASYFRPKSNMLASAQCVKWSDDESRCLQSQVMFWDMATGQQIGKTHTFAGQVEALSPDGRTIVTTYCTETLELICTWEEIILWDVETDLPIGLPLQSEAPDNTGIVFRSDGKTLVAVGCVEFRIPAHMGCTQSQIVIWDVETHKLLKRLQPKTIQGIYQITFDPHDKMLASNGDTGWVLWNIEKQQPIGQPLTGPNDVVAFSPDGTMLATGGCRESPSNFLYHGEIILWDVATRQPIGQPLRGHIHCVNNLVFSPDGKTLWSSAEEDPTILQWNLDIGSWRKYACEIVGRNFTRAEWADFFSDEPYPSNPTEATCPQWPIEVEAVATPIPTSLPATTTPTFQPVPTIALSLEATRVGNPPGALININTASRSELESLPGIDPTTAQRIIEYRQQNGPFLKIEDIVNVPGIGPGTFEHIKDMITVSG